MKWIALISGGVIGTLARYGVSAWSDRVFGERLPMGTFLVNITGCFLIGLFAALAAAKEPISANLRLFLTVGFCGAFTTFSSLILETDLLAKNNQSLMALANVVLSVLFGFAFFRFGIKSGEWLGNLSGSAV